ncbi:aminopeptidase [Nesterenkonia halophila]|uniref:hypothetical protein n=1 Tax=Nesterenkonia halophila TaxID=302044 RepID=UPI001290A797|nr:hypothetical protein [Nesterenkonia halophila]
MEVVSRIESNTSYLDYEATLGARKLIEEIMLVSKGENVVITADTASDMRVVDVTAAAAYAVGANPVVIRYPTSWTSAVEPSAPIAAAIAEADVWIEYQLGYLMHSEAFRVALGNGCRYINLTGMDVQMLVDTVGRVDYAEVTELGRALVRLLEEASEIRITSPAGTDITATIGDRPINLRGLPATEPGQSVMLSGQISFNPYEDTQNGVVVFDGGAWPPNELGLLSSQIRCEVSNGVITEITGPGTEAATYANWLSSFDDPNMHRIAHWSLGFNPGVPQLTGRIVEDERVFGTVEFGMGTKGSWIGGDHWAAAAHTDASMNLPSIHLDGTPIEVDGRYVHPEIVEICRRMGIEGY